MFSEQDLDQKGGMIKDWLGLLANVTSQEALWEELEPMGGLLTLYVIMRTLHMRTLQEELFIIKLCGSNYSSP